MRLPTAILTLGTLAATLEGVALEASLEKKIGFCFPQGHHLNISVSTLNE
jgi:hypothetical protein